MFKYGDTSKIENFRPASIINSFSKVFEIILHSYVANSIRSHLSACHHGFVQGRSRTTNLAGFTDFVSSELDVQDQMNVVNTDFTKAFNRIDRYVLFSKLNQISISNAQLHLFQDYLILCITA